MYGDFQWNMVQPLIPERNELFNIQDLILLQAEQWINKNFGCCYRALLDYEEYDE